MQEFINQNFKLVIWSVFMKFSVKDAEYHRRIFILNTLLLRHCTEPFYIILRESKTKPLY